MITIAAMTAALALTQPVPAMPAKPVLPSAPPPAQMSRLDAAIKAGRCLGLDAKSAQMMANALKIEEKLPAYWIVLRNATVVKPSETTCGFVQDMKPKPFQQNAVPLTMIILENQKTGAQAAYLFVDLGPDENGVHLFEGAFLRDDRKQPKDDAVPL